MLVVIVRGGGAWEGRRRGEMEEMAWEGMMRWLYAFQVLACALVLYSSRAFAIRKAAAGGGIAMEKTAATIAAPRRVTSSSAFIVFQRAFLTVFFLASSKYNMESTGGREEGYFFGLSFWTGFFCSVLSAIIFREHWWKSRETDSLGELGERAVADGLQHVYGEALYQSYALKRRDIALLLAVGHATSLLLGTFLGASADNMYVGHKSTHALRNGFRSWTMWTRIHSNPFLFKSWNGCEWIHWSQITLKNVHWLALNNLFWAWNFLCLACRGRKRMCMLYCFLQVLAFFAKQMNNFKVLCFAHVCLGLSAALYFSAFEAWMTTEHEKVWFLFLSLAFLLQLCMQQSCCSSIHFQAAV